MKKILFAMLLVSVTSLSFASSEVEDRMIVEDIIGTYEGVAKSPEGPCFVSINFNFEENHLIVTADLSPFSGNSKHLWSQHLKFFEIHDASTVASGPKRGWFEVKDIYPRWQSVNLKFPKESNELTSYTAIQRLPQMKSQITVCEDLRKIK